MKIVVVGGGNIGTLLYAELTRYNKNDDIFLCTRNASKWANSLEVTNQDKEILYSIDRIKVTSAIVDDADYYFFALPKHIIKDVVCNYINIVKKDTTFIFLPGTGGVEFLYTQRNGKNIDFVGMQRVPYIARLNKYGQSVSFLSKKEQIFVSSMGKKDVGFLSKMLNIKVETLPNYLCVTLTPSNPILHTTRIYSVFSKEDINHIYHNNILFYESWDNNSSENLLGADEELQQICKKIPNLDLRAVKSLKEHYESKTSYDMTKKLSSIQAFKGILSPMKKINNDGYIVDLDSRYFLEDFNFGLVIIKSFAEILQINTPYIDKVLRWYGDISNNKILDTNNKLILNDKFLVPQKYGITTVEQVENFYK